MSVIILGDVDEGRKKRRMRRPAEPAACKCAAADARATAHWLRADPVAFLGSLTQSLKYYCKPFQSALFRPPCYFVHDFATSNVTNNFRLRGPFASLLAPKTRSIGPWEAPGLGTGLRRAAARGLYRNQPTGTNKFQYNFAIRFSWIVTYKPGHKRETSSDFELFRS